MLDVHSSVSTQRMATVIEPPVDLQYQLTTDQLSTFDFDRLFDEEEHRRGDADRMVSLLFWIPGEGELFITREQEDAGSYLYDVEINSNANIGAWEQGYDDVHIVVETALAEWRGKRGDGFNRYACPLCGWREDFYLEVKMFLILERSGVRGSDEYIDHYPNDGDRMDCRNCSFEGVVKDYLP